MATVGLGSFVGERIIKTPAPPESETTSASSSYWFEFEEDEEVASDACCMVGKRVNRCD